jgi:hypothetical protein
MSVCRLLAPSFLLLLPSCVLHIGSEPDGDSWSNREDRGTVYEVRDRNRHRLRELRVGMSEADVDKVMGTESTWIDRQYGTIGNPYKTDGWTDAGGEPVVVRYYYTMLRKRDGVISDDELTPVVLRRGQLAGWGEAYLARLESEPR